MSAIKIMKEMYHCKCEAVNTKGVPCAYEWEPVELPLRCPSCKSRKWNRGRRQSLKPPITFNGETLSIAEWTRKLGLAKTTISWRLKQGWPIDQVLSKEDWRVQQ